MGGWSYPSSYQNKTLFPESQSPCPSPVWEPLILEANVHRFTIRNSHQLNIFLVIIHNLFPSPQHVCQNIPTPTKSFYPNMPPSPIYYMVLVFLTPQAQGLIGLVNCHQSVHIIDMSLG